MISIPNFNNSTSLNYLPLNQINNNTNGFFSTQPGIQIKQQQSSFLAETINCAESNTNNSGNNASGSDEHAANYPNSFGSAGSFYSNYEASQLQSNKSDNDTLNRFYNQTGLSHIDHTQNQFGAGGSKVNQVPLLNPLYPNGYYRYEQPSFNPAQHFHFNKSIDSHESNIQFDPASGGNSYFDSLRYSANFQDQTALSSLSKIENDKLKSSKKGNENVPNGDIGEKNAKSNYLTKASSLSNSMGF
jgi:hypothetical protein